MSNIDKSPADRAAINRENARRGVPFGPGPRTPEGKQRASLNAMRHGLTGQTMIAQNGFAQGRSLRVPAFHPALL
jgi:hypothetical protein